MSSFEKHIVIDQLGQYLTALEDDLVLLGLTPVSDFARLSCEHANKSCVQDLSSMQLCAELS